MGVYETKAKLIEGREVELSEYKGKVLLIVNTASECGFTPQYEGLETLYNKYKDRGFEILGFPSNQFGAQEPGTNSDIQEFCKVRFGVTFPLFEKGDVRGPGAHPLFVYLTRQKPFLGFDKNHPIGAQLGSVLKERFPDVLAGDDVKWNFTKFVVDRRGKVVSRHEPTTSPSEIEKEIEALLD